MPGSFSLTLVFVRSFQNGEYHTMVVNGPMYQDTPLHFVNVTAHELLQQRGQNNGERWWVIAETAKLVPVEEC